MLGKDLGRDQPHRKQDPELHDDQVVEITDDGNEIGNEVDWGERVDGDGECHRLGILRYARIACREIERVYVALDAARPIAQPLQHGPETSSAGPRRVLGRADIVDRSGNLPGCVT